MEHHLLNLSLGVMALALVNNQALLLIGTIRFGARLGVWVWWGHFLVVDCWWSSSFLWIVVEFGGNAHWWLGSGHYSLLSSLTTRVSIIDEWGFSNFLV